MNSDRDFPTIPLISDPVLREAVIALARSARFYKHLFLLTANAIGLDEVIGVMTDDDKVLLQIATIVTTSWEAQLGLEEEKLSG